MQALSDLKILDLSMNLPGPYMTWILTGFGCDVLKVENPAGGDYARTLGSIENSPYFETLNENKRSLALNLKSSEGRDIFLRLIQEYDILVEGFRPGVMEKLGIGFETTREINPRLIHVAITGYGQVGPFSMRPGHDLNYVALAGILGMTGTRSGESVIPGIQIADIAGGALPALCGLLIAVIERNRTGKGRFVDISMFDGALALSTMVFAGVQAGFDEPGPGTMFLNGRFPCYGLYKTLDGKYMSLGALERKFWINFCAVVDRPDLLERQYGSLADIREVENIFGGKTQADWIAEFEGKETCSEPVLGLHEATQSRLVQTRNMLRESETGALRINSPLMPMETRCQMGKPAPKLGRDTEVVLEALGFDGVSIEKLRQEGIVA